MMKDPTPRAIRLGNGSQAGAPKQAVRGRGRPAGMVPAAATRARIVRAAREVYSRRGYHGTTMREVADRAGVSRPLVSVYFPGRPSVYRATIKATYLDVLLPAVGRAVHGENSEAAAVGLPRRRCRQGGRPGTGLKRCSCSRR
jgi:AcrR family transcriptional regulator